MPQDTQQLRRDALAIWNHGLAAVRSDRTVREHVHIDGNWLEIAGERLALESMDRIAVVGAGKAGAGMADGLEQALGDRVLDQKHVSGWLNVPADCVRPLRAIHLHAARPAGINEPTAEGAAGSREIMRIVESLGQRDLCIALISGGGSALLPLPLEGITLEDKLAVTRFLSAAGAPIDDLNTVRKQLSQIKGGKLARACRAGRLITLVISDVLGDPLELIASGPTVEDTSTPADALSVLDRYGTRKATISTRVFETLTRMRTAPDTIGRVTNHILGNNQTAVSAAAEHALELGYAVESHSASKSEGAAEDVGRHLADRLLAMCAMPGPRCLVSGGEPTVKLVPAEQRGLGGRNQQLVLAAAEQLEGSDLRDWLILSAGTDGEDGPTDAAGAWVDRDKIAEARRQHLSAADFLARNDAYHWFEPLGSLVKTGATDTNVCDVRVVLKG